MTYREAVRAFKRQFLLDAIREHGTMAAAARVIGVNRTDMIRICRSVGIPPMARHRGNWGIEEQRQPG